MITKHDITHITREDNERPKDKIRTYGGEIRTFEPRKKEIAQEMLSFFEVPEIKLEEESTKEGNIQFVKKR